MSISPHYYDHDDVHSRFFSIRILHTKIWYSSTKTHNRISTERMRFSREKICSGGKLACLFFYIMWIFFFISFLQDFFPRVFGNFDRGTQISGNVFPHHKNRNNCYFLLHRDKCIHHESQTSWLYLNLGTCFRRTRAACQFTSRFSFLIRNYTVLFTLRKYQVIAELSIHFFCTN